MIFISKDSITFRYIEVDELGNETEKAVDVLNSSLGIVSYLAFPAVIEEGVTVKHILDFLAENEEATDYVFDSSLGGHPFKDFMAELSFESIPSTNIKSMEICHDVDEVNAEMMNLFETTRLRGIGGDGKKFSVEFSPISSYMNIPIKLNTVFNIKISDEDGEVQQTIQLNKDFTLHNIIHAILFEISYYGTYEMRQSILDDILKNNEFVDIEEVVEDPADTDDIRVLEKDLMKQIEKEDYEAAARLRDRIRQIKDKGTNSMDFDINKK